MFKDRFITFTDSNGVTFGQRSDRNGRMIGRPVKVSDPHYVPDWSAGDISDGDENMRRGLGFAAFGTSLAMGAAVVAIAAQELL